MNENIKTKLYTTEKSYKIATRNEKKRIFLDGLFNGITFVFILLVLFEIHKDLRGITLIFFNCKS